MTISGFLAGVNGINAENAFRSLIPLGSTVSQFIIYFGAILLVTLAVFAWVMFSRRQRHRRHSSRHHSRSAAEHYRRREHRRRYETLAETGGLPPIRVGQQHSSPH